jgi:D-alanyl-D-alanine dipeptidase
MSCSRIKIALLLSGVLLAASYPTGQSAEPPKGKAAPRRTLWSRREEPMVEISKVCKTICIELRYATARNFTGRPIYPSNARALLRRSVAARLQRAQDELRPQGLGLKIWDAYRPAWAHDILWRTIPDPEHVASPAYGGSFHTWGASVDVTLVDTKWQEQPMPTDFDDFTPAAKSTYQGPDPVVAKNMKALRTAMLNAGFKGIRDEWWHFTAEDALFFIPVEMPLEKGGKY